MLRDRFVSIVNVLFVFVCVGNNQILYLVYQSDNVPCGMLTYKTVK